MESQYELLHFASDSPFRLSYLNLGEQQGHWHNELEILFVLMGKVTLVVNDQRTTLNSEDIVVINKNTIHSLNSDTGSVVLSLQLNLQQINDENLTFECNSAVDTNKNNYYTLKHLIAVLVKNNSAENNYIYYENQITFYSLLTELLKNFKVDTENNVQSKKYLIRLTHILDYIDEHYKEAITLNQLADEVNLSVPYLSSFFEKYLGVNFLTYYNELRLERAVNELLSSDESVEQIAANNGFTDSRSFVTLFKKKYNTLPSIYRKETGNFKNKQTQTFDSKSFVNEGYLSILAKYLPNENQNAIALKNKVSLIKPENVHFDSDLKILDKENIDISKPGIKLNHNFKKFTSIGRAKELLLSENQKMLTELQQNIGYEYIKFHGLLSDDMLVYKEDEKGNPKYSFVYIDKAFDFLQSINLKPLVQFSFTPGDLASDKNLTVYASPFNKSFPKDIKKWKDLIKALTLHLIDRYSIQVVKEWLFTVWNEPDTTRYIFGFEKDQMFYDLYKETYDTVKQINKELKFGTPSLFITDNLDHHWTINFLNWCTQNNRPPEFININYYADDFAKESIELHSPAHPAHNKLVKDEDAFKKCIQLVKNMVRNVGYENVPIYLTEWNLTVSHRNLLNDTCFKSCYLAKNLLENYDQLNSFGYWVLTDLNEEIQLSPEEFHGGLGLFTIDGIKKPHYYMFSLLNQLGDELVERGDGYFITKSTSKIQICLYNYEHFNHLFASGETYNMTFTERYTPFSRQGKMEVSLKLTGINSTKCRIQEVILNQNSGSAFDEWIKMGAQTLTPQEIEYLKHISIPHMYIHNDEITEGTLNINVSMAPLEFRFIEVKLCENF